MYIICELSLDITVVIILFCFRRISFLKRKKTRDKRETDRHIEGRADGRAGGQTDRQTEREGQRGAERETVLKRQITV